MSTSRSSSGVVRRPSAPRPHAPRAGAVPRGGSQPAMAAHPEVGTPPPGPPRGSSVPGADAGRGGKRVVRVRARTPKLISARAMVLAVVVLLAFVLVYPTLHSYLAGKSAVAVLQAQVTAAQQTNDNLNADLARWQDPAYVTAQARERLSYVMPGETAWRVVDPQTVPGEAPDPGVTPLDTTTVTQPWYTKVWQSVVGADQTSGKPAGSSSDTPGAVPTP